ADAGGTAWALGPGDRGGWSRVPPAACVVDRPLPFCGHRGHEVACVVVLADLPGDELAQPVGLGEANMLGHGVRTDVADERPAVLGGVVEPRRAGGARFQ